MSGTIERKKVNLLSNVWLFATLWTIACQAPPSMGFSKQEFWSGLPFPSPGDLPNPGIESMSPALAGRFRRAPGKPHIYPCPETEASKISPFGTGIQKVLNSNIVLRPILYVHMCLCVPTQGLNPGLLHCRQILYHLSHQGSRFNWSLPSFCVLFTGIQDFRSIITHFIPYCGSKGSC